MSGRRFDLLVDNEIYHVFNRSVANEYIFKNNQFLLRALDLVEYYRFPQLLRYSFYIRLPQQQKEEYTKSYKQKKRLISIYAYCFMPNHYHFLVKQLENNGIKKFVSNFQNSFAKYFNTVTDRHGSIFQKPFKAKRVATDEEFLHVSRYIHLNPVTSYNINFNELELYPWTSYQSYMSNKGELVDRKFIIDLLGTRKKYKKFIEDQVDYQRKLNLIKHLT